MTGAEMAAIHAEAFTLQRPWSAGEFATLLTDPTTKIATRDRGFGLLRVVPGEAEILTLAVHPDAQRRGLGRALVLDLLALAKGADRVLLEVAQGNAPAIGLYASTGFLQISRRRNYYRYPAGGTDDAIVMERALSEGI